MRELIGVTLIKPVPLNSGGKLVTFNIMNMFSEKTRSVLIYLEDRNEKAGTLPDINFELKTLSLNSRLSKLLGFILRIFPKQLRAFHPEHLFNNELRNIKADVVYLDFPYLFHIAWLISKQYNAPIILGEHNIEWKYYKNDNSILWRAIKLWEEFVISHVDAVITISYADYKYLKSMFPDKRIIYLLPLLPEVYNYNIPKTESNVHLHSERCFNLLFYGRLDVPQNQYALRFIREICGVLPDGVCIHIFGSGNFQRILGNLLKKCKKVRFYGTVDNPLDYVERTDAVLVPLRNSGGVKLRVLESLYLGKIVFATPEAVEGLPPQLRELVFVFNNELEFFKLLESVRTFDKKELRKRAFRTRSRFISEVQKSKERALRGLITFL